MLAPAILPYVFFLWNIWPRSVSFAIISDQCRFRSSLLLAYRTLRLVQAFRPPGIHEGHTNEGQRTTQTYKPGTVKSESEEVVVVEETAPSGATLDIPDIADAINDVPIYNGTQQPTCRTRKLLVYFVKTNQRSKFKL